MTADHDHPADRHHLADRLRGEAPDWRGEPPGDLDERILAAVRERRGKPLSSPLPIAFPRRWFAAAAAALLVAGTVALAIAASRRGAGDPAPTALSPVVASAPAPAPAGDLDRSLAVALHPWRVADDAPLAGEMRALDADVRATANFLIARLPGLGGDGPK